MLGREKGVSTMGCQFCHGKECTGECKGGKKKGKKGKDKKKGKRNKKK